MPEEKMKIFLKHIFCSCVWLLPHNTSLLNFSHTSFVMYLAGGWARWGETGNTRQLMKSFCGISLESTCIIRSSSGTGEWPSVLNTSDTLIVEADRDVCFVFVRKRIAFKLSLYLSAALLRVGPNTAPLSCSQTRISPLYIPTYCRWLLCLI